MVLEVDAAKRRIALGLKQCMENPWQKVAKEHPVGTVFDGKIRNITEFGLFVAITDDLDGMVHMSDISWSDSGEESIKGFSKDQVIKVKVLEVDPEKERIALGIKQLADDPYASTFSSVKKGDTVTCEVTAITDGGIEVLVNNEVTGFIKKTDLSKERSEQRPDRYAVGEKVDAKILSVDAKTRRVNLSIKSQEIHEEREAMAAYGSTDSGASLGDILGAAFDKVKDKPKGDEDAPKKAKKAAKKDDAEDDAESGDDKPKKKAAVKKTKASDE
jgi:small subunit ribosomal protein S1